MSTTIESLELQIQSNSASAQSGITALKESLEKLKTATKGGVGLTTVAKQISAVATAVNSINSSTLSNLTGLANAIKLLSGVKVSTTIGKNITAMATAINTMDMSAFTQKVNQMVSSLVPLANQMQTITKGFSLFQKGTTNVANSVAKVTTNNNASATSFLNFGAKVTAAYFAIKKMIDFVMKSVTKISDYIEDVNLFTVSMGEFANEAKAYAETVSEIMGIDPGEWMRNQGIFQTLATGFGVASDKAYIMSKNLTQLGYDLSSFFNLSTDEAMEKLQSGLAGELEPLRRIGYDLSQAKLEATALELGIDKSVSSMTQAEKAMLRYYAIMTQVTTVQGDMARTLEAPANQMRIFTAQIEMLGRAIGSMFIPLLNKVLPYLIAATKVLRELVSGVASLLGFEMPDVDYSGVSSMESVAEDTSGALDEATESAKKLKSYMLGFDELNVINPDTGSSGVSDDTIGAFDFELPEYDFLGEATESRVAQIVEEMKEWLGITGEIDSWSELLDTRFGHILNLVGQVAVGIAAWKILDSTIKGIDTIHKLLSSPSYSIAIGVMITLMGVSLTVDGIKDAITRGLDKFNFAEIVGGSLLTVGGAALLGSKITTWLGTAFESPKIAFALARIGKHLGVTTSGAVGAAIGAAIVGVIAGIAMYFTGIYDACKDGLDWLNGILISLGSTLAGAGIGWLIGGPVGAAIGALIGLAVGVITDLVILIVQEWDKISAWFVGLGKWFNEKVIQPIGNFFKGLWKDVSGFFSNLWEDIKGVWGTVTKWFNEKVIQPIDKFFKDLWEGIKEVWNTVANWFNEKVIQPLVNFFAPIVEWISQFFYGCWLIIQAVWVVVSKWFNETVIQPVVNFFKGLWEKVSEFFVNLWEDIKNIWNTVANWFNTTVIQPVVGFFKGLWESVSGFFSSLWKNIKAAWESVPNWFNTTIIVPVVGFFKGVWTSVSEFFVNLWSDIKGVWKTVATWFTDTIIEPVKKAFKTACDAISGFFSSLWLGIRQGVAIAMNGVIAAIEAVINWIVDGINKLVGGFDKVVQWAAKVLGKDWGGMTLIQRVSFERVTVPTYAQGGYPESGQAFIARENGIPEMVGTIGRRTAVANNDQIVDSVASGVAEANGEQNALLREQNTLLRALLEKDSGVYLDGRSLSDSVDKYKREQGRVLIAGGAL